MAEKDPHRRKESWVVSRGAEKKIGERFCVRERAGKRKMLAETNQQERPYARVMEAASTTSRAGSSSEVGLTCFKERAIRRNLDTVVNYACLLPALNRIRQTRKGRTIDLRTEHAYHGISDVRMHAARHQQTPGDAFKRHRVFRSRCLNLNVIDKYCSIFATLSTNRSQ